MAFFLSCRQLNLNTIYSVNAVDEQDQDEDESDLDPVSTISAYNIRTADLHAILQFRYQWIPWDKGKKLALPYEWKRYNEQHENTHLRNKQEEYLESNLVSLTWPWETMYDWSNKTGE